MNGQSTVSHPTNSTEQLVGKFHVEKLPNHAIGGHEETGNMAAHLPGSTPAGAAADESACASRFQMIRVDRNFAKGRWKVNDYEPPENTSASTNLPVNPIENEPVSSSNPHAFSTMPTASSSLTTASLTTLPPNVLTMLPGDPNATSSTTLAASAAAALAFQQHQQRLALNNPGTVMPGGNVPNPTGLLHAYPGAPLPNMPGPNQPYLMANHPQFGYYPYYASPYGPYGPQWAAMAANPYLAPPPIPPPGTLGDPNRHMDAASDGTSENPVISSNPFQGSASDHLQNAQLAAAQYHLYAAHHPHSNYLSQLPPGTVSPYATIAAYHAAPQPPSIIPPTQSLSIAQAIANNPIDFQQQAQPQSYSLQSQQHQQQQQPAPVLTSPKHDVASAVRTPVQQQQASTPLPKPTAPAATQPNLPRPPATATNGTYTDTLRSGNPTHIADLLSSSPSIINSQQTQSSLLSPITVQTTNPNNNNNTNGLNKASAAPFNEIWSYTTSGSPLNLSQSAAQTAAVMGLLNNESGKDTGIAQEIFKELNTPTKQNNTTDIDNKISAAMDLVKVHLLTAVRDEVTELRQQIRILTEKVNTVEHENAFLRQHVPSEIYAQYTPPVVGSTTANDLNNPTTAAGISSLPPSASVPSSQSIPMASLASLPSSIAAQLPPLPASSSTVSTQLNSALPSSINHPAV